MQHPFIIRALSAQNFTSFFNKNDEELAQIGGKRMIVDAHPGFPCRVSLEDASIGEEVILLPFSHHPTSSPYQASGPIFIRKQAKTAVLASNMVPKMLLHRVLSLRAYDASGWMQTATVVNGSELSAEIETMFSRDNVAYIHIHNAKQGCFNCTVERA